MAYLDSFAHREAFSNQVEMPGIASIVHEDNLHQATYGNHCEIDSTTILTVYNDVTNSKGMVRIGKRVSDFAIEWGTEIQFYNGSCSHIIPIRISDSKFLIVYKKTSDGYGYSIAGTITGTVPTFGTELVFNSATTTPIGAVLMDTDKVIIAFANSTTNGQCVVASLTGTSIAYGAIATFKATTDITGYMTLTQLCKHSTTLASVVYRVSSSSTQVVTLTLSGTTITPNTAGLASFGGASDIRFPSIGALSSTAFVIAFTDITDTNKGNAQVGTISGTTITAGASQYNYDTNNYASRVPTVAIISSTMFAIMYAGASTYILSRIGILSSSTAITFGGILTVSDGYYHNYPSKNGDIGVNITYTANGELTFSYLAYYLNQFVVGMLIHSGLSMDYVPMCYKIVTAGIGEQIELSSVYLKGNGVGFQQSSNYTQHISGQLYLNGTLSRNEFYSTADEPTQMLGTTITKQTYTMCKRLDLSNNPIILKEGETLYGSIKVIQYPSNQKGSCTVFGLRRI